MQMKQVLFAIAGALAALPLASRVVVAQDSTSAHNAPACLRFQFGVWTPALNWKGAGHGTPLDSSKVERAPDGRAWAAAAAQTRGDSVLVLYPSFWPAGVALSFDARKLALGDTASARATAFVADAKIPSPVSTAKVWAVDCRHAP